MEPESTSKRVGRAKAKLAIGDITPNNVGTLRKLNSVLFPVAYSDRFYKDVVEPRLADFCKLAYYNDLPVGAVCCRVETSTDGPAKLYIMTLGVLAPYRRLGLASLLLAHVLDHASRTHQPPLSSTTRSLGADIAPTPSAPSAPTTAAAAPPAAAAKPQKLSGKDKKAAKAAAVAASEKENVGGAKDKEKEKEAPAKAEPLPALAQAYVHVQHGNDEARLFYERKGFTVSGEVAEYYRKIEPRGCWILAKDVAPPPS